MSDYSFLGEHRYSLAATGIKFKDQDFNSRLLAEKAMYKALKKNNLHINEVYDDKHFKTYLCNNGIRFYIGRI